MATIKLWKYNRVTGLWDYQRTCEPGTGRDWLAVFRKDEPSETFILGTRKPKGRPV